MENLRVKSGAWHRRSELRLLAVHYAQFCAVGASGVVVDMGVLHLLAAPALRALNLSLSKAVAAEVALVNNFTWNDLWTFRGLDAAGAGQRGWPDSSYST